MNHSKTVAVAASRVVAVLAATGLLAPQVVSACATCYGNPESAMTQGMNQAILFLLGIVGLLYVGFLKVFWDIRKRSRLLQARRQQPLPLEGGER
jgi:hypothetical protein